MTIRPTKILLSPPVVIFVTYVGMFFFQLHVIFPFEAKLFPVYATTASLMFLPHAVRVLATVIVGPKTFFFLFPALVITELLKGRSLDAVFDGTSLLITVVSAGAAPAAYILLKAVLKDRVDFSSAMYNWRFVFLVGIIASAINSIGIVAVYVVPAETTFIPTMMLRFFAGDIFGLFVGLVVLTFLFRLMRGVKAA